MNFHDPSMVHMVLEAIRSGQSERTELEVFYEIHEEDPRPKCYPMHHPGQVVRDFIQTHDWRCIQEEFRVDRASERIPGKYTFHCTHCMHRIVVDGYSIQVFNGTQDDQLTSFKDGMIRGMWGNVYGGGR